MAIVAITGPSGSGKSTLARNLLGMVKSARILTSTTCTRKPRECDILKEYEYTTESAFDIIQKSGGFAWYTEEHGNKFGTRKHFVDRGLSKDISIAILNIDGIAELYGYAEETNHTQCIRSIYLDCPPEICKERLLGRDTESARAIARRVKDCKSWRTEMNCLGISYARIDATLPKGEVSAQALEVIGRLVKHS